MKHYPDSSFLVSCYITDGNTAAARAWLSRMSIALPFAELHALEVRNAFQLGVFRGLITAADATATLADLKSDLNNGRLVETPVDWKKAFRLAIGLSERHVSGIGARSLDILHLAAARSLRARELISFDPRQRLLATALGLSTSP